MFEMKFRGEANLSVATLKPSQTLAFICLGLCTGLLACFSCFHHLLYWCICSVGVQWLLENPGDHNGCVFQVGAIVSF